MPVTRSVSAAIAQRHSYPWISTLDSEERLRYFSRVGEFLLHMPSSEQLERSVVDAVNNDVPVPTPGVDTLEDAEYDSMYPEVYTKMPQWNSPIGKSVKLDVDKIKAKELTVLLKHYRIEDFKGESRFKVLDAAPGFLKLQTIPKDKQDERKTLRLYPL